MRDEKGKPLTVIGVLDGPEARFEPLRRELPDAIPGTAHVFAVREHDPSQRIPHASTADGLDEEPRTSATSRLASSIEATSKVMSPPDLSAKGPPR